MLKIKLITQGNRRKDEVKVGASRTWVSILIRYRLGIIGNPWDRSRRQAYFDDLVDNGGNGDNGDTGARVCAAVLEVVKT